jgi:hypothetical protein
MNEFSAGPTAMALDLSLWPLVLSVGATTPTVAE